MLQRMEIIKMERGFPGDTPFPYTAAYLAAALTLMVNQDDAAQQAQQKQPEEVKQEETL